jgi:hypothetical protein
MATVESFRNKPFDILEKMRNDAMMRQQLQDQAIARQYNQQKNELDLAQAQQDLEFSRQGLGKNVPATVAQMMYREKLNPSQRELFDKTIVRGSSGFKQINLGDSIGLYDANTGEIVAHYPKGAGPKYITDALGNPVLLGGGGGGGNFNMGNVPTAPTPTAPTQQGSIDDQLNNLGSMNPPAAPTQGNPLTPPTQGNVPAPATQGPNQRTLMGPVRLANGTYVYNNQSFGSDKAAWAAYEFDLDKQKIAYNTQQNIAQKVGETTALNQIEAQSNLGKVIDDTNFALQTVQSLKNSSGLPAIVGQPFSISKFQKGGLGLLGAVPGTDAADATAFWKQIQGQAFLDAFERLRGGGQITVIEGEKATAAKARLDRAQSIESITSALNDLEEIFLNAQQRAYQKAGVSQPTQNAAQPMMPAGGGGFSIREIK